VGIALLVAILAFRRLRPINSESEEEPLGRQRIALKPIQTVAPRLVFMKSLLKRIFRWPPQWLVFLTAAVMLALVGYLFLPPDESQNLAGDGLSAPTIGISVDRPGVQLLAVLDGSLADSGSLSLNLYADSVPGGFRWAVLSQSTMGVLRKSEGSWTDKIEGANNSTDSDVYTVLTSPNIVHNLQTALRAPDYGIKPFAELQVKEDNTDLSLVGADMQVILPTTEFFAGSGLTPDSSTKRWYSPDGSVVVLAPNEEQTYQTDVVSPGFSSPGMWMDAGEIATPYWAGTDPAMRSREDHSIFVAGLALGIAGSALIACMQDIALRYRSRRDKRAHT
jgi:hypothetical protein